MMAVSGCRGRRAGGASSHAPPGCRRADPGWTRAGAIQVVRGRDSDGGGPGAASESPRSAACHSPFPSVEPTHYLHVLLRLPCRSRRSSPTSSSSSFKSSSTLSQGTGSHGVSTVSHDSDMAGILRVLGFGRQTKGPCMTCPQMIIAGHSDWQGRVLPVVVLVFPSQVGVLRLVVPGTLPKFHKFDDLDSEGDMIHSKNVLSI
jgi:hypothetical protein